MTNTDHSKFFSFVLRHEPQAIGLALDREGWACIDELIAGAATQGRHLSRESIADIVAGNDKKRFAVSEDGERIRAVQGHSTGSVDRSFEARTPPERLFHGTASRFLDAIRAEGLRAGSRHHVHLSADESTARRVGQRHGSPTVLQVNAGEMHRRGFAFFQAENGVWLTASVPVAFLVPRDE